MRILCLVSHGVVRTWNCCRFVVTIHGLGAAHSNVKYQKAKENIKMEEIKTNYKAYLLPALCLVVGILIGFLLSPVKSGKICLLSHNTIGSKNGCGNKADDMMVAARKEV